MLIKWFNMFYLELKDSYDLSVFLMVLAVGAFAFLVDYKSLQDKKLKKEAKLCRFIGIFYVLGGIGLFVVLKIF